MRARSSWRKARWLSESYDNWFLMVKPLDSLAQPDLPASRYRDDLIQMVEEVSGGIRLGALNEIRIEVLMTPLDSRRWYDGRPVSSSYGIPTVCRACLSISSRI